MKTALVLAALVLPAPLFSQDDPLRAVPFADVIVQDQFWSPRLEVNRTASIVHAFRQCEETGRLANFSEAHAVRAGDVDRGTFHTRYPFDDSDVFKVIEGASYTLRTRPDSALSRYLDSVIALVAGAQEPDGYLYTMVTMRADNSWAPERWVNARREASHELYNAGHLYEAAVAHHEATGKTTLLDVAVRNADLLVRTFGPNGVHTAPGHQEVELGLLKLFRLTGRREYLDLAEFFLEQRGRGAASGDTYNQDHRPVSEQMEAVGHAVRAGYQYTAMAELVALGRHPEYRTALERLWQDLVGTKLYVTGGVGSAGSIEGFSAPYDLPNVSSYCETCAAIAMVLWNHRMFLLSGKAQYADILERTLYNGVLSGVSLDGERFFYVNPLESQVGAERSAWFTCACCPSNIVRFLPQVPGYAYAQRGEHLYVNLFLAGSARVTMAAGPVTITQRHRYPWDGTVRLNLDPGEPREIFLHVRIPGWARNEPVPGDLYRYVSEPGPSPSLWLNDEPLALSLHEGYVVVRRVWTPGDELRLELPLPVRRLRAHPAVEDDRGKVALERGPLVYCLEGDQTSGVWHLVLPDRAELSARYEAGLLSGVTVIGGQAMPVRRIPGGGLAEGEPREFGALPYAVWANRGRRQMVLWLAREAARTKPLPAPSVASGSTVTSSGGKNAEALADQLLPRSPDDRTIPFFHWYPKRGTREWVEYQFRQVSTISRVSLDWVDEPHPRGCQPPRVWELLARVDGHWHRVVPAAANHRRTVEFPPVRASALRLELELEPDHTAGIYEWTVE